MSAPKSAIPISTDLFEQLELDMSRGYIVELAEERSDGCEIVFVQKSLFGVVGGLKIHVYADEHPPPHFHVKYAGEDNSFSLLDATPLYPNGPLKKWFKNIKKWHAEHQMELIDFWNKMRPQDCPVGIIHL